MTLGPLAVIVLALLALWVVGSAAWPEMAVVLGLVALWVFGGVVLPVLAYAVALLGLVSLVGGDIAGLLLLPVAAVLWLATGWWYMLRQHV